MRETVRRCCADGDVQEQKTDYQNVEGVQEREPGAMGGFRHVYSQSHQKLSFGIVFMATG